MQRCCSSPRVESPSSEWTSELPVSMTHICNFSGNFAITQGRAPHSAGLFQPSLHLRVSALTSMATTSLTGCYLFVTMSLIFWKDHPGPSSRTKYWCSQGGLMSRPSKIQHEIFSPRTQTMHELHKERVSSCLLFRRLSVFSLI